LQYLGGLENENKHYLDNYFRLSVYVIGILYLIKKEKLEVNEKILLNAKARIKNNFELEVIGNA
jgi:hypothetical protein